MAAHSSILAWRIPWTEEPGKLYSSWGHKESDMTEWLTHTDTHRHTLTVWEGARTGAASPHITRSAYLPSCVVTRRYFWPAWEVSFWICANSLKISFRIIQVQNYKGACRVSAWYWCRYMGVKCCMFHVPELTFFKNNFIEV